MSGNTTTSNNFTGLYGASGATVVPTTPYGNANVVALLAVGTDGGNTVANIVATGNVTANYFLGNGSQLTGIASSYGNANVTTLLAAFGSNTISTTGNISGGYILGNGSQLTGLPATYSNANVVSLLASFGSNTISTTGNVTAGYVIGNGSLLTNITGANVTGQVANALVAGTVYTAAQPNITSVGTLTSVSVSGNITGGNLLTTGQVSATGNITTAGFFLGTFAGNISGNLTVPGSNTQVLYNNNGNAGASAGFTFDSAANLVTVAGNISGGNVSTVGNVTGAYILGNGSQLTGLPATYGNANVAANLAAFANNPISTTGNITASYLIGNGSLLTSITGANVTGTVANATYALNSNAATFAGTVTTAAQPNITSVGILTAINTSGAISATGNIQGNVFIGNGAGLTNIPAGNIIGAYGNANVALFLGSYGSNTLSTTGNVTTGNLNVQLDAVITGNLTVNGNTTLVNSNVVTINDKFINVANNAATAAQANGGGLGVGPAGSEYATLTYNSTNNDWNTNIPLSVTGNVSGGNFVGNGQYLTSITGGNVTGTVANATYALNSNAATFAGTVTTAAQPNITSVGTLTSLTSSGNISTTGNVTANYFLGNGSQLTGIASSYGNANVSNFLANGFGSNTITTTGNITAGNMALGAGNLSFGTVIVRNNSNRLYTDDAEFTNVDIGATLDVTGYVSATGNVTGGNLFTGGVVSATGNIQGNVFIGNGAGLTNIPAGNIVGGYGNANVATFLANGFGSNTIVTTGNITANNFTASNVVTLAGTVELRNYNNRLYTNDAEFNTLTVDTVANIVGNVIGGNILTTGYISATGNVTGAYFIGNGSQLTGLPATYGNANVSNFLANGFGSNTITTTGNITGGNILTAGIVSVAGNVTANNASLTGNLNFGTVVVRNNSNRLFTDDAEFTNVDIGATLDVNGIISATGNITGNYFLGNGSQLTGISASPGGSPFQFQYNNSGAFGGIPNTNYYSGNGTIEMALSKFEATGVSGIVTVPGTAGYVSVTGNVIAGNVQTGGVVSATGNVTGNYFLGNGSQLTGIAAGNAAGANTQIQFNNGNAFAGNSLMTFDNVTGNVTLANLIIGTSFSGNVEAGGNAVRINPPATYSGVNGNIPSMSNSQMIIGSGAGNLSPLSMGAIIRSSQLAMFNIANVVEVANAGGIRYSSVGIGGAVQIGNLTNANTVLRALASSLNIGGGPSANVFSAIGQGINQVTAFQGVITLGNVGGTQPNVGNVTVGGVTGTSGFVQVQAGATANSAAAINAQLINAGNIQTGVGVVAQLQGTSSLVTPVNAYGFYMPTVQAINGMSNGNAMRVATNYYFLYNADAVAQNQLGSLRAYHTFQAGGNTSGTWDINKNNGQVQAVSLTGNVTIGSYTNFVTTANDSVNNDTQSDTVTLIIEQGATPYTVTMPTGNTAIRYASNVTTVTSTANTTTMIAITAYRTAANATGYLTTISPAFS